MRQSWTHAAACRWLALVLLTILPACGDDSGGTNDPDATVDDGAVGDDAAVDADLGPAECDDGIDNIQLATRAHR